MATRQKKLFKHSVSIAGLSLELVSDDVMLHELNFVKGKKTGQDEKLPAPVKKALLYLNDYFAGKKSEIEIVPVSTGPAPEGSVSEKLYLDMNGYTEKEIKIYNTLLNVPSGDTVSYKELAEKSGIHRGARFAGNCMADNRFPILIPCHRVIKTDGSMGNYTGGVGIKNFLLKLEKDFKNR